MKMPDTVLASITFEGIPKDATPYCPPPFLPAALTLQTPATPDQPSPLMIEIDKSSQVVPNRNALLVGRQAAICDIRITHKSLSRQHALLYYHQSDLSVGSRLPQLMVFDLGTKSGTFVNQQRIEAKMSVPLKNGDVIQFGKSQPPFTVQWNETEKSSQAEQQEVQPQLQQEDESEENVDPFEGLTGRERRQAEIAAMMASLDETPTYSKYVPTDIQQPSTALGNSHEGANPEHNQHITKLQKLVEKHHLPLTNCTDMTVLESSHISSMIMDPTGARFAIGSMDSSLKLYDFAGYNPLNPLPFQNVIIEDGYPIRSMAYSSTGDRLLIATGSSQPYVVDRDGQEIVKFVRGDVYVTDPSKTIGHTAAVTSVGWHPLEKSIVFTTSRDGSLRKWNIDKGKMSFSMLTCEDVVVIKHVKTGRKTIPTCLTVTSSTIATGTECGSLQIYKYPFVSKLRPQQSVRVVPNSVNDEAVVCLVYSVDASKVAVRTQNLVTVWNAAGTLVSSSTPWMMCGDVPIDNVDNNTPTMSFSPSGRLLCVATSRRNEQEKVFVNEIIIYVVPQEGNNKGVNPVHSIPILNNDAANSLFPVSGLSWHVKLNQILVTTTQGFQMFYSTRWSKKGILLTSGRRKKRQAEDDLQELYESRAPPPGTAVRDEHIIAPNALPLFGGEQRRKKKRGEEEHKEALAKHIPQKPAKGVYDTANTLFTQMIMDNQTSTKIQVAGLDPREALAKYKEGKSYISGAYKGNVERILTDKTVEEEEEDMKKNKKS
jgi:WD repeat-containing protein 70